jgi:abhydrolase domain-containing protein 17
MLLVIVALYLGFALFAYFLSDSMIFLPHASSYKDSPEILKITTADGKKVSALYLPNPAARYTLLVSHGNAEDLGDDRYWLEDLRRAGFSIFAYDYEGYGTSEGKPSERAVYEDEAAAYDYLAVILKTEPDQIIIFGRSVGTGPATYIASRRPSAGLILQSPFVSAFRVLTKIPMLPFDKFPNGKYIRHVHSPVLIMHSHGDSVIPFWHGQKMFDLANEPKRSFWVRNADHNDMDMVKDYYPAIQAFAATLEKGQPHPLPSVPAPKIPDL